MVGSHLTYHQYLWMVIGLKTVAVAFSETTMARAMYKSINTVAIEIGQKLGVSNILEHAHKLGIDSELRAEQVVSSEVPKCI